MCMNIVYMHTVYACASLQCTLLYIQVLYLMDRFNMSDKFYHELSMVLPSMHWVPMPHHGVYCSLRERQTDEIEELVSAITTRFIHKFLGCSFIQK